MAGRFLSPEEAARHLGISIEEVNRLVDRKKLFPLRDGKFKLEEIERIADDMGADSAPAEELTLDIDLSSPSLVGAAKPAEAPDVGDSLAFDEEPESIFGADAPPSRTIVREAAADGGSGAEGLDGLEANGDDLALESIAGASSLSGIGATPAPAPGAGSGTRLLDLGDAAALGDSLALGSGVGLSAVDGPGPALSGIADSGLSLEDVDLATSGIDAGSAVRSDIGGSAASVAGMSLGGDEFNLGVGTADDESASVVIATEETNDSSFFGTAIGDDSASVSFEESSGLSSTDIADGMQLVPLGPQFRAIQIVGLVCCTMLLLTAVMVMVDLVHKINEPTGKPFSSPLLQGLAGLFGWR